MKLKDHLTEILNSKTGERWESRTTELYEIVMYKMGLTEDQTEMISLLSEANYQRGKLHGRKHIVKEILDIITEIK